MVVGSHSGLSAGLNAIAVQSDGRAVGAGQVPTGLVAGNDTEVGLMRVFGPTVSVANPPIKQVTATGNTTVNFTVSVDEPLSTGATASVCGSTAHSGRGGFAVWHCRPLPPTPRPVRCRLSSHVSTRLVTP